MSREAAQGGKAEGFGRISELLKECGAADVGAVVASGDEHFLFLHDYGGAHGELVRELLDRLRLTAFQPDGSELMIPIRAGLGRPPKGDAILLGTRSVLDLLRLVGDSIEIPEAHLESGFVEAVAPSDANEPPFIRIRSARERPDDAAVAIPHRGWWFYIDATDIPSKRDLVLLRAIIRMGLENAIAGQSAPRLTLPVR